MGEIGKRMNRTETAAWGSMRPKWVFRTGGTALIGSGMRTCFSPFPLGVWPLLFQSFFPSCSLLSYGHGWSIGQAGYGLVNWFRWIDQSASMGQSAVSRYEKLLVRPGPSNVRFWC